MPEARPPRLGPDDSNYAIYERLLVHNAQPESCLDRRVNFKGIGRNRSQLHVLLLCRQNTKRILVLRRRAARMLGQCPETY